MCAMKMIRRDKTVWPMGKFMNKHRDNFMDNEGSLLCSQEPGTGTYAESNESSPQPYTLLI
jgi:hypothetical protein